MEILVVLVCLVKLACCQSCTFPSTLWGNWTTTEWTLTIGNGSPSMTTSWMLPGATGTMDFNCLYISGSKYVLRSTQTISAFSGTVNMYAYMCMDIRNASSDSYYFYMNSEQEVGFGGVRMVWLTSNTTTVSDVCTTTVPVEEFHPMVKIGSENEAVEAVMCPEHLRYQFSYTYTDNTGTYYENSGAATVQSCLSENLTKIQINKEECTQKIPLYSSSGLLGCLFSVYSSTEDTYYTALYNLDAVVSPPFTYRFTCLASKKDTSDVKSPVHVSIRPTKCSTGMRAKTLPTDGALMTLTPNVTAVCNPVTTTTSVTTTTNATHSGGNLCFMRLPISFTFFLLSACIVM